MASTPRRWTRDRAAESGKSYRFYRANDGWIAERSYWEGVGNLWRLAENDDANWDIGSWATFAEAKDAVDWLIGEREAGR